MAMQQVLDMRAMLARLQFNIPARDTITDASREAITIDNLPWMSDDDVETLCKSVRRPGGTVPGLVPPGAPPGTIPPQIPNPGNYVSALAERNLKIACFIAFHFVRTQRILDPAFITMDKVNMYQTIQAAEKEYHEPTEVVKLLKVDRVLVFIVNFAQQLHLYNGQGNRPLSYIIRQDAIVPAAADDPTYGEPDSKYESIRDEVSARASHTGAHFSVDNARVFELLNSACGEHELVKAWTKPYVRTRNGRLAWTNFKSHFRGDSEMEAIEVAAERKLATLKYRKEGPRYTFEGHVSMHRKAHNDLLESTGTALPEPMKVRKLLASIEATNLLSAVGTIRASPNLKIDFDAAVNFLKGYIAIAEVDNPRNVSAVKRGGTPFKPNNNKKGKKQDSEVRWYTAAEWRKLPADTKKRISQARDERKALQSQQKSQSVSQVVVTDSASTISAITSQRQTSDQELKKGQK
jgi:hypothetical protein